MFGVLLAMRKFGLAALATDSCLTRAARPPALRFHRLLHEDVWSRDEFCAGMPVVDGVCRPACDSARYVPSTWLDSIENILGLALWQRLPCQTLTEAASNYIKCPSGSVLVVYMLDVSAEEGVCVVSRDSVTDEMEATHLGRGEVAVVRHTNKSKCCLMGGDGVRYSALVCVAEYAAEDEHDAYWTDVESPEDGIYAPGFIRKESKVVCDLLYSFNNGTLKVREGASLYVNGELLEGPGGGLMDGGPGIPLYADDCLCTAESCLCVEDYLSATCPCRCAANCESSSEEDSTFDSDSDSEEEGSGGDCW